MEKPATDIYTFEILRKGGFTYVDKTGLILPLVGRKGSGAGIEMPNPKEKRRLAA